MSSTYLPQNITPPPSLPPFVPKHLATKPRPLPTSSSAGRGARGRRVSGPFVEREDDDHEGDVTIRPGEDGEQDDDEEEEEEDESDREVLGGGVLLREEPPKKKGKEAVVASSSKAPAVASGSGSGARLDMSNSGSSIIGSSGWERARYNRRSSYSAYRSSYGQSSSSLQYDEQQRQYEEQDPRPVSSSTEYASTSTHQRQSTDYTSTQRQQSTDSASGQRPPLANRLTSTYSTYSTYSNASTTYFSFPSTPAVEGGVGPGFGEEPMPNMSGTSLSRPRTPPSQTPTPPSLTQRSTPAHPSPVIPPTRPRSRSTTPILRPTTPVSTLPQVPGTGTPSKRPTTPTLPLPPITGTPSRTITPTLPFLSTMPLREFKDSISKARSDAARALALALELEDIQMSPTKRRASGSGVGGGERKSSGLREGVGSVGDAMSEMGVLGEGSPSRGRAKESRTESRDESPTPAPSSSSQAPKMGSTEVRLPPPPPAEPPTSHTSTSTSNSGGPLPLPKEPDSHEVRRDFFMSMLSRGHPVGRAAGLPQNAGQSSTSHGAEHVHVSTASPAQTLPSHGSGLSTPPPATIPTALEADTPQQQHVHRQGFVPLQTGHPVGRAAGQLQNVGEPSTGQVAAQAHTSAAPPPVFVEGNSSGGREDTRELAPDAPLRLFREYSLGIGIPSRSHPVGRAVGQQQNADYFGPPRELVAPSPLAIVALGAAPPSAAPPTAIPNSQPYASQLPSQSSTSLAGSSRYQHTTHLPSRSTTSLFNTLYPLPSSSASAVNVPAGNFQQQSHPNSSLTSSRAPSRASTLRGTGKGERPLVGMEKIRKIKEEQQAEAERQRLEEEALLKRFMAKRQRLEEEALARQRMEVQQVQGHVEAAHRMIPQQGYFAGPSLPQHRVTMQEVNEDDEDEADGQRQHDQLQLKLQGQADRQRARAVEARQLAESRRGEEMKSQALAKLAKESFKEWRASSLGVASSTSGGGSAGGGASSSSGTGGVAPGGGPGIPANVVNGQVADDPFLVPSQPIGPQPVTQGVLRVVNPTPSMLNEARELEDPDRTLKPKSREAVGGDVQVDEYGRRVERSDEVDLSTVRGNLRAIGGGSSPDGAPQVFAQSMSPVPAQLASVPVAAPSSADYTRLPAGAQPFNPLHVPHRNENGLNRFPIDSDHHPAPPSSGSESTTVSSDASQPDQEFAGDDDGDDDGWPPKGWGAYVAAMSSAVDVASKQRKPIEQPYHPWTVDELGGVVLEKGQVLQTKDVKDGEASGGVSDTVEQEKEDKTRRRKSVIEELVFDQDRLEFVHPSSLPTSPPVPPVPASASSLLASPVDKVPPVPALPPMLPSPVSSPPLPTNDAPEFEPISRSSSIYAPSTRPPSTKAPSTRAPSRAANKGVSHTPTPSQAQGDSRAPSRATSAGTGFTANTSASQVDSNRPRTPNKLVKRKSQRDRERERDKEKEKGKGKERAGDGEYGEGHTRSGSVPVASGSTPLPASTSVVSLSHSAKSTAVSKGGGAKQKEKEEKKWSRWKFSFRLPKRSKSVSAPSRAPEEGPTKATTTQSQPTPMPKPILKRPGTFEEVVGAVSEEDAEEMEVDAITERRRKSESDSKDRRGKGKSWYRPEQDADAKGKLKKLPPPSEAGLTNANLDKWKEGQGWDAEASLMPIGPSTSTATATSSTNGGSSASSATLVPYAQPLGGVPHAVERYQGTPDTPNRSLPISPLATSSTGPASDYFDDVDEGDRENERRAEKSQRRSSLPASVFRRPLSVPSSTGAFPVPGPQPFTRAGLASVPMPIPKPGAAAASLLQNKAFKTAAVSPPTSRPTTPKVPRVEAVERSPPFPHSNAYSHTHGNENSARRTLPGSREGSPSRAGKGDDAMKRVSSEAPQLPPLMHLADSALPPNEGGRKSATQSRPQTPLTPYITPLVLSEPLPETRTEVDMWDFGGITFNEDGTKRGSYAMYEARSTDTVDEDSHVPIEDQNGSHSLPDPAPGTQQTDGLVNRYEGLTSMRPSNLPPFVPAHVRTSSSPQRISYVYMPAHRRGSRGSVDLLSLSGEGSASQASFGVGMERPSGMALHSDAGSSRARIVNVNGGGIVAGGSTGGEATGSSETDSTHSSNVPKTSDSGRIGRLQADAMSMVSDSFGTITPRESVFGLVGGPTAAAVVTPRESVQSNATVRAASQPIPLSAGMAGVGAGGSKPTGQHPRSTSRASRMWKVWSPNVASPTSPSPSASSVDVQSQSVYTGTQSGVQSGRTTALSTYSNATGVANVTVGRNGASEGGEGISRSSSLARGGSSLGRSVGFAVAEGSSKEKSRKEKDIEKERKEGGGTKLKKKRKIPFFEMVAPAVGGTKE